MSPELLLIWRDEGYGEFDPVKSDIFSLGLSILRLTLRWEEKKISGMNEINKGEKKIQEAT